MKSIYSGPAYGLLEITEDVKPQKLPVSLWQCLNPNTNSDIAGGRLFSAAGTNAVLRCSLSKAVLTRLAAQKDQNLLTQETIMENPKFSAAQPHSGRHSTSAVLVLSLATLVAAIDTNIVNIGLPTISRDLHTGFSSVQWVMLSYMLAVTALVVGVGRIGDLFGKKRIFTVGLFLFSIFSLLCGLSRSIGMLIAMRALQGVGGAILMSISFALVADLVPEEKIMGSMAALTAMLPIGFALGPTVGGLLLSLGSWRYLFFFNVPLGLVALLLSLRFPDDHSASAEQRRFDWLGLLLLAATLVAYIMGITQTENVGMAWGTALLFLGALAGLVLFLIRERRERNPLVELSLFRSGTFNASLIVSVLVYTVITGNWLIVPFYLQQAKGLSTLACGMMMTVGPVGCALFTPVAGKLAERFGSFAVMKAGVLAFAVGTFCMSTLSLHASALRFIVTLFCFNGSLAFFQTPNNAEVISSAQPEKRGVASGLLNLSRTVGQVTGTAVLGAIFYFFTGTKTLADAEPARIVTGIHYAYFIAGFVAAAAFLIGLKWLVPQKAQTPDTEPGA